MITVRPHSPTLRAGGYTPDPEAIVTCSRAHANGPKRSCHSLYAVRFLDAQLSCTPDGALAAGARGGEREQRQLVDQARHLLGAHGGRDERRRLHQDVADGLAAGAPPPVRGRDPRTHPLEDVEEPGSRRV